MTQITYKGQDWTFREFKVEEFDYSIVVAPYSLYESLDLDDEYDNFIDEQVAYYVDDEDFNLPAQELFEENEFLSTLKEEIL
jgi:hypothetical protein